MVSSLQLLEILEIYWNLKTLLEISLNLLVLLEIFVQDDRPHWFPVIKLGIAYLSRNWSPYFIFTTAPCCIKCIGLSCDERWLEISLIHDLLFLPISTIESRVS